MHRPLVNTNLCAKFKTAKPFPLSNIQTVKLWRSNCTHHVVVRRVGLHLRQNSRLLIMLSHLNTSIRPSNCDRVESRPAGAQKESILIVDDSSVVRKVFSGFLSEKFECYEAG